MGKRRKIGKSEVVLEKNLLSAEISQVIQFTT